jgi:hypothetical protein
MKPLTKIKRNLENKKRVENNIFVFDTRHDLNLAKKVKQQQAQEFEKIILDRIEQYNEIEKESLGCKKSNCIEIIKELKELLKEVQGDKK